MPDRTETGEEGGELVVALTPAQVGAALGLLIAVILLIRALRGRRD